MMNSAKVDTATVRDALLATFTGLDMLDESDIDAVRRRVVFTTHTPVPAGHDKFPVDMVRHVLGAEQVSLLESAQCIDEGTLNLTHLALRLSRFVNGVAMKHREVSQGMFPRYPINSITNGVHASTWSSPSFQALFDKRIPEWRADNYYLRYAIGIPLQEIRAAHAEAKQILLNEIKTRNGVELDPKVFTIGFARRATPYKRADLVISNPERLLQIADAIGPIQIVFGGKAHPHDVGGKELIHRIHDASVKLADAVKIVYVENYEMDIAAKMVAGVDLWLNNPMKPLEASGTSGMKAALNGVPSLSVLDGWWIEGHIEGVTGWSIGTSSARRSVEGRVGSLPQARAGDSAALLRAALRIRGSHALGDRTQRLVLQHAADGGAVRSQRVLPGREPGRGTGRLRKLLGNSP